MKNNNKDYAYTQIAYTIPASEESENREYRPLEMIIWDNYPRYLLTTDKMSQKRNDIIDANIMSFIKEESSNTTFFIWFMLIFLHFSYE